MLGSAVVLFAVVWTAFVFSGSLATYLGAVVIAMTTAAVLGARGSWFALMAVITAAMLVGTEARGDLGTTTSALGGVRLLDYMILAAAGGALRYRWREGDRPSVPAALAWLRRWAAPLALLAVLLVLWGINGARLDAQTNTDVRLVLIAAGTLVIARVTLPGNERAFLIAIASLTLLLVVKSIALHLSTLWTIGTDDRAQAVQVPGPPDKRTILVGGDTLFILAPGIAAGFARRLTWRLADQLLLAIGAACLVGVLLSGTRTSLIIVVVTALMGASVNVGPRIRRIPVRTLIVGGVLATVVLAGGAIVSGVGERFAQGDGAHDGLNFRRDEVESIQKVGGVDFLIGQGLGGRFLSRDSAGNTISTPWSHVVLIWIILKIGVIGLVASLLLAGFLAIRLARGSPTLEQRVALVLLASLLLMSLLIDRAALPEGVMIAIVCFVMLGWGSSTSPSPKANR